MASGRVRPLPCTYVASLASRNCPGDHRDVSETDGALKLSVDGHLLEVSISGRFFHSHWERRVVGDPGDIIGVITRQSASRGPSPHPHNSQTSRNAFKSSARTTGSLLSPGPPERIQRFSLRSFNVSLQNLEIFPGIPICHLFPATFHDSSIKGVGTASPLGWHASVYWNNLINVHHRCIIKTHYLIDNRPSRVAPNQ